MNLTRSGRRGRPYTKPSSARLAQLGLISGILLVAACTAGTGGAHIYPRDSVPAGTNLDGIVSDRDRTVVLYVHGMGETSRDFSNSLLDSGERFLGKSSFSVSHDFGDGLCGSGCRRVTLPAEVYVRGEALDCSVNSGNLCIVEDFGEVRKSEYHAADKHISVFSFYWDSSADRFQEAYVYGDSELADDSYRPLVNRKLKRSMVTYGFSDAALYLGPMGRVMRTGLEVAICIMLRDALGKTQSEGCSIADFSDDERRQIAELDVVFVAKSLGSRYLFDTLLPADQLDALVAANGSHDVGPVLGAIKTKKALAASMSRVYLLANQLPLIGLGRVQAGTADEIARRDLAYCNDVAPLGGQCDYAALGEVPAPISDTTVFSFAKDARREYGTLGQPTVYAYHDPSDLLGFKAGIHLSDAAQKNVRIVDITHRNARQWLWVFGRPDKAHAREDEIRSSAKIIWCGGRVNTHGGITIGACMNGNQ